MDEIKFAKLFHQVYEDLAPSFGYKTRTDTKEFDENSKNGKLMIATCKAILSEIKASLPEWHDCGDKPELNNFGTSEVIEIETNVVLKGWYDRQWDWIDFTGKEIKNPKRWRYVVKEK